MREGSRQIQVDEVEQGRRRREEVRPTQQSPAEPERKEDKQLMGDGYIEGQSYREGKEQDGLRDLCVTLQPVTQLAYRKVSPHELQPRVVCSGVRMCSRAISKQALSAFADVRRHREDGGRGRRRQ